MFANCDATRSECMLKLDADAMFSQRACAYQKNRHRRPHLGCKLLIQSAQHFCALLGGNAHSSPAILKKSTGGTESTVSCPAGSSTDEAPMVLYSVLPQACHGMGPAIAVLPGLPIQGNSC